MLLSPNPRQSLSDKTVRSARFQSPSFCILPSPIYSFVTCGSPSERWFSIAMSIVCRKAQRSSGPSHQKATRRRCSYRPPKWGMHQHFDAYSGQTMHVRPSGVCCRWEWPLLRNGEIELFLNLNGEDKLTRSNLVQPVHDRHRQQCGASSTEELGGATAWPPRRRVVVSDASTSPNIRDNDVAMH